jgi:HEAT repeat protein
LLLAGLVWGAPLGDPLYDDAMDLLDRRKYDEAYRIYQEYIEDTGARTDAALYWQAYAMYKMGRSDRAIGRLNRLLGGYPGSEWHDDAEALMVEVRGDRANPDEQDDVHLKILALQSVMRQDPDTAVSTIQRIIDGSENEATREQAIFVLGQAGTPAARELLYDYARDASRPELALSALQQIAIFGGAEASQMLSDLYDASTDVRVRQTILSSYMITGDSTKLLEIARSDADPGLREEAISLLGAQGAVSQLESLYTPDAPPRLRESILNAYMFAGETGKLLDAARNDPSPSIREQAVVLLGASGGTAELEQLYRTEQDPAVRRSLVNAFMVNGDPAPMLQIAQQDADPEIRQEAIQMLGVMGASDELAILRREDPSREVMQAVLTALMVNGDATQLIEIARNADDREVRSMAVQHLAMMDTEDALQYMLEILEEH